MLRGTADNLVNLDEAAAPISTGSLSTGSLTNREQPRFIYPFNLLSEPHRLNGDVSGSECLEGLAESATWWLVYTKSRQEKRLSDQLAEMCVPHYLPVHQREAVTRGKIRTVEEPLFAGYLFLLADDDQRRDALATNRISVTHAVTRTDAERLPSELASIANSIASGARLTLEAGYEPGDWVRVKAGPHAGLEGTVLRRKNKTKLVLSVTFLKQGASFEIADSFLERIDPPKFNGTGSVEIVGRRGL